MDFNDFKCGISSLILKSGGNLIARFSEDKEKGRYIARISDGTKIIGNAGSRSISVSWGSGHMAIARI